MSGIHVLNFQQSKWWLYYSSPFNSFRKAIGDPQIWLYFLSVHKCNDKRKTILLNQIATYIFESNWTNKIEHNWNNLFLCYPIFIHFGPSHFASGIINFVVKENGKSPFTEMVYRFYWSMWAWVTTFGIIPSQCFVVIMKYDRRLQQEFS